MNKQQIFDKVYQGLASQNFRQSSSAGGRCLYRGPDGLKCAIGWLIPDDEYHESFEKLPIIGIAKQSQATCKIMESPVNFEFSNELQLAHDHIESQGIRQNLEFMARKHNLTIPEVPNA
jgi:hypothetical protein